MPSYLCFGIHIRCNKLGHSPQTSAAIERIRTVAFCDQGLQGGETDGKRECAGHKQPRNALFESTLSREGQTN